MKSSFKLYDDDNREFKIISCFDIIEKNKSYVIYTDNSFDENNNINIYASSYDKYNNLKDIEDEDERRIINSFIDNLLDDILNGMIIA